MHPEVRIKGKVVLSGLDALYLSIEKEGADVDISRNRITVVMVGEGY